MYKLMKNPQGVVCAVNTTVNGVEYSIPFDQDNTDYQEYLRWLEAGNTPEPAEENQ